MKKIVPSFVKTFLWKWYLRYKHGRHNKLGRGVILSKDCIFGQNCTIGGNTIIGQKVIINNNVKIGGECVIEKLKIDDFSFIESRVICTGYGNGQINIGKHTYIGLYNILDWSNNITIGDFVHIAGPSTGLWTHSSAPMCLNSIPLDKKEEKFRPTAPITIESNVYIGCNCTVYPGITIGHHSVVAPNSAVTKDVEPYTMVGGVPAKVIKHLSQE